MNKKISWTLELLHRKLQIRETEKDFHSKKQDHILSAELGAVTRPQRESKSIKPL